MEVWEAIRGRRSIRKMKGDPIPEERVLELLEAVKWAPSWANTQCWEVILVGKPEIKESLAQTLLSSHPHNPAYETTKKAPWVLVFLGQKGKAGYLQGKPATDKGDWLMFDVALAVQNFCLAAWDKGLGTVIVGAFDAQKAKEILRVPEDREVVVIVPLGVPEEIPEPRKRKEVREFLYREVFGEK
jgi:nitroreductase